jgi:hypothetical protein
LGYAQLNVPEFGSVSHDLVANRGSRCPYAEAIGVGSVPVVDRGRCVQVGWRLTRSGRHLDERGIEKALRTSGRVEGYKVKLCHFD